jgi:hypothetical protein
VANRCFALTIEGCLFSSYRANVLHFQSTGTNDNDTVAAGESLINGFAGSPLTQYLATLPANYSTTRLTARRVDLKPSATTCKFFGFGTTLGTRGTDGTGQQTAPSVFLVPTMGTKSGGKIFWPTIPQADLVNNIPATAWQTLVNTFIASLISGFTNAGITWTLAVYSRKLNSIANVASHSFSPVVGFQGNRRKPVGAV